MAERSLITGEALPEPGTVSAPASAPGHVAGLTLGYMEAGPSDAPALVMLHGIGSNATGFRCQLGDLSDQFRTIAWDAPGYGGSDEFVADAPLAADYADALAALLAALGVERCHLLGSSMGAVIAVTFAARWPERIRTLILCGPTTGRGAQDEAAREAAVASRIANMEKLGPEGIARTRAAFLLAADAPAEVLAAAVDVMTRTRPRGYAQGARMVAAADILPAAGTITAPTLILRGTEDRIGSGADPLNRAMANSELHMIEGAGHLIKLEAPEAVNPHIRRFAARHT